MEKKKYILEEEFGVGKSSFKPFDEDVFEEIEVKKEAPKQETINVIAEDSEVEVNMPYDSYEDLEDIDFDYLTGDFDTDFSNFARGKVRRKKIKRGCPKPLQPKNKIIVPDDRKLIVQGREKFKIGSKFHEGEKLQELNMTIDNTSNPIDFTMELFNPSAPLDYLYNSTQNLNSRITIADGVNVAYSDVLFNLLANPTMIVRGLMVCSALGTLPANTQSGIVFNQMNQAFQVKNKNIKGWQDLMPYKPNLDAYQKQSDIVSFEIMKDLNRPFVVDGMDVLQYTVLANSKVVLNFYYKQIKLKELVFPEYKGFKGVI
jgi:hypothetical protein